MKLLVFLVVTLVLSTSSAYADDKDYCIEDYCFKVESRYLKEFVFQYEARMMRAKLAYVIGMNRLRNGGSREEGVNYLVYAFTEYYPLTEEYNREVNHIVEGDRSSYHYWINIKHMVSSRFKQGYGGG